MFCVSASFIYLLHFVVRSLGVSVACVREICEDGCLCQGIEVSIPLSAYPDYSFAKIFWGCHADGCLAPLECAALHAILFLQSIYGFAVIDYSYGGMLRYRLLASAAVETASVTVRVCHHFVDQGTTGWHCLSCLHPAYMPLQYPLLFPYGEHGYQLGIHYQGMNLADENCRLKVTMQDYYCYRCHYKMGEPNPFLCYGRLSEQAKVDGYACVEESRLKYISDHQDELRCEYFQGIVDVVGKGTLDGNSIGKKKFLPASFTCGKRYMAQNYQDALAISRVYGCPDWFTTFTANPKWKEVFESLETEPGQQPCDRSDVVVRVYKIKLDEMLNDIKDGTAFGPAVAVLQSIEF